MLIPFLFTLLGSAIYLQIGFQLGRIGWNAWALGQRSNAAFILFPVSWYRDVVGGTERPPHLESVNPPQAIYKTALLVLWPLQLLRNLALIAIFFGPDLLFKRLSAKAPTFEQESVMLEQRNRVLDEESKKLDQVIWQLESGMESDTQSDEESARRRA